MVCSTQSTASHSKVLNRWAMNSNNQAPIMPFLRRAWMFSAKSKHLMGVSFLASLDGKFASMLFFNCGNTCQMKLDLNFSSQIASTKIAWKTSSVLSTTKGVSEIIQIVNSFKMLFAMSLLKISLYTVRKPIAKLIQITFAWYSKCHHGKARNKSSMQRCLCCSMQWDCWHTTFSASQECQCICCWILVMKVSHDWLSTVSK